MKDKNVAVLGIGNMLLSDEGIGVHAAQELMKRNNLPENVGVYDVGTLGLMSAPFYEGRDLVILIDAVAAEGEPGKVIKYTKEDIMLNRIPVKFSPHQIGFQEALLVSDLRGECPKEVLFYGVIPASYDSSVELSEEGKKAMMEIVEDIEKLFV